MDAITQVPMPVNEPIHDYAPQSPERARLRAELASLADHPIDLPHVIGGKHRMGDGERIDVVQPHRHAATLGTLTNAGHADATAAIDAAMAAKNEWAATAFRRARRGVPAGRRPAGRSVAGEDRRRDDARPIQVRLPGRDRFPVRADRLLAVQRGLRPSDPGAAADQRTGGVEPQRVPPAGRLRLRDHAVQLHLDRGQPADRARADGQHRGVEAVDHPDAVGVSDHAAARGRRIAARGDQPGHRRRPGGFRCGAGRSAAGRHPLHRIDGHLPAPVAAGGHQYRPLPQLSAAGRRDRRQRLRGRTRLGAPGCAVHGADSRGVRLPGPEMLGGIAGIHPAFGVAADG